jgi:RNA polymerase sigma-70 factor (ECF subfamily)
MVLAIGAEQCSGPAHERFCELYWYPVYAFIRRSWPSRSPEDALEATQEFFAQRLAKRDLERMDPKEGRFRNWIMSAVSNLLRNQAKYETAAKRDRRVLVWLDAMQAEARLRLEPRTSDDPVARLERDLALATVDRALARLGAEYRARGAGAFFARAAPLLVPREIEVRYAELERLWGLSEQTLKVRIKTMRRRLARLVCDELGVPLGDPKGEAEQLAWLFRAIDPRKGSVLEPSALAKVGEEHTGGQRCRSEEAEGTGPV